MTDLEQLVAAVVTQWRADGGDDSGPIAVNALLDRVLPYRVARRILSIDASEDYEVLVLRLLSEEEQLVRVTPPGAAEMARTTSSSKLPDLAVLQLLRSATFTVTERALAQAADSSPVPKLKDTSVWAAEPAPAASHCWSCAEALPAGRAMKFCPFCGADQRQPVCAACGAHAERGWRHCPDCGAAL